MAEKWRTVRVFISSTFRDMHMEWDHLVLVVFPAVTASINAIRSHRDYLRNSMHSAEMVRHLTGLRDKMIGARDNNGFLKAIKEAEEIMLHENEDWCVVVRFHVPEVPV